MERLLPHIVAIGASGSQGLEDIKALLELLPASLDAIIMVVLHRPSDLTSNLRGVLASHAQVPVVVASDAESLQPGFCYIGEPDGHLSLVDSNLAHLVPGSAHRLRNRTIDTLFESLARHAGRRTIGIVLSGSLSDGSKGLAAIHQAKGLTMVLEPGQKPRGMQQNAIDYDGPIGFIGTAVEIAQAVAGVIASGDPA